MGRLEDEFDEAMMNVYRTAKEECDYIASYFRNMLHEHGGVETAHRLLEGRAPQLSPDGRILAR